MVIVTDYRVNICLPVPHPFTLLPCLYPVTVKSVACVSEQVMHVSVGEIGNENVYTHIMPR